MMKNEKLKKVGKFALLGLVVASLSVVVVNAENIEEVLKAKRIGGKDRIETSVELSKDAGRAEIQTAILAGYSGEVDALTGTSLTKKFNGRMFMTKKNELSEKVLEEMKELNVEDVILLGGHTIIGREVENELKAQGFKVRRIAGDNRGETSYEVAKLLTDGKSDEAFVALGYRDFADALSIGPVSAKEYKPILLTNYLKEPTDNIEQWLTELGVRKVTIIGGTNAISIEKERAYKALGIEVERIGGDNREDTSVKIAEKYNANPDEIIIANGYNSADAVNGGYYANEKNGPIIVTPKNKLKKETADYISKHKKPTTIIGKEEAVDRDTEDKINEALKTTVSYKTIKESIPFKTINKNDNTLAKGTTKVQTNGVNGEQSIRIRVTKHSSGTVKEERVGVTITKKPVDKVVLIGTKVQSAVPSHLKRDAALEKEIGFAATNQDEDTFQLSKRNENPKGTAIIDNIVTPFVDTTANKATTSKLLNDAKWKQKHDDGYIFGYTVDYFELFDKTYPKGTNRKKIAEEALLALLYDGGDNYIKIRVYTNTKTGETVVRAAGLNVLKAGEADNINK